MVVVLRDQLFHLGDRILPAFRHVFGDIRDLRPDHHATLVAEIIEILCMLIVGKTDRVRSYVADDIHILFMHLVRDRVAETFAVLMPRYPTQRITFSVEVESCFGMIVEVAHAKACGNFICCFSVFK